MWLMSPQTALWLVGAFLGAVTLAVVTPWAPWLAVIVGAIAGGTLASLALGKPAERLDRWLQQPKFPRR